MPFRTPATFWTYPFGPVGIFDFAGTGDMPAIMTATVAAEAIFS